MNDLFRFPTEIVEKILSYLPDEKIFQLLNIKPELRTKINRIVLKDPHFIEDFTISNPTEIFYIPILYSKNGILPPGYNSKRIGKILDPRITINGITYELTAKELNFSNQIINDLDPRLKLYTELEVLNLSNTQLRLLPDWIGDLTSLRELILANNLLTEIPNSIGNLNHLEILNLLFNRLIKLPESIGNLERLYILNLSFNRLQKLPESIGNLIELSLFYLSRNELIKLPNSIANLDKLQTLDLENNSLQHLPDSFINISIDFLNLQNNLLEEFLEMIQYPRLLNLSNNRIRTLSPSLTSSRDITSLKVSSNQLTELDISMPNLTHLYADNNQITNVIIHPDCQALQILSLNNNPLTEFPSTVYNSPNLWRLYLTGTEIETFDPETTFRIVIDEAVQI